MVLPDHSKLLMATLEPLSWQILSANATFTQVLGACRLDDVTSLCSLCPDLAPAEIEALKRRHLIPLILRDILQLPPQESRLWDEPQTLRLRSMHHAEPRYVQCWVRWEQLRAERLDPARDEFAALDTAQPANLAPSELLERIAWDNYRITGELVWEGLDITPQETLRRLNHQLLDLGRSVFDPPHLQHLGQQLELLFEAQMLLILSFKGERIQPFFWHQGEVYTLDPLVPAELEHSHFQTALREQRIWNVPDLQADSPTAFEAQLQRYCRSLLLLPIAKLLPNSSQATPLGVVVLGHPEPHQYDQLDISYAEQLLPAFRTALLQVHQQKFARIHPAVEWRFSQEADRRSMGLTPEKIVFRNLYPMFAMSDIRGSSNERNRAIQADLVRQFQLAIAILAVALQHTDNAYLQQIYQDVVAYAAQIEAGIQVEDEVTALNYLQEQIEPYFEALARWDAATAIAAYREACTNAHACVYEARDRYDQMIAVITNSLRQTWDRWQSQMQAILPHYCDTEVSDGIDHMIYVGADICADFSPFHLHSLRYEQLRALCDCARTCFALEAQIPLTVTHLVLVQDFTVDIFHDEDTEKLFDVMGTRDTRYEIVKKRIDKANDQVTQERITQPGMITVVYSTETERCEYLTYLRYLEREGWIEGEIRHGNVEPLQGVTGLKYMRIRVKQQEQKTSEQATIPAEASPAESDVLDAALPTANGALT